MATLNTRSEVFLKALTDVIEGGMSIRGAANKWGVNRQTLNNRLKGKVGLERRKGPPPILTAKEEDQFAESYSRLFTLLS